MTGAIAMAGMAASRCGAGLVRLAVPDSCLETVAGFSPCFMLLPLPGDDQGRILQLTEDLEYWLARSTCVAVGPGMGRSNTINQFFRRLLERLFEMNPHCPLVVDADGLIALCSQSDWREFIRQPIVLTPHPGEWSRMSGIARDERQRQEEAAIALCCSANCTILLKGHETLVTNGEKSVRNQTGTPAMAIGGSGDVLTGVITALICQGMSPFDAARLGAHVHGRAGEIAAYHVGGHVVLPTELIDFLPVAFSELESDRYQ